jgi:hypothetical protein
VPASRVAAGITAAGAGVVLVGSFLPWYRSGRRARSSYDLFAVVERIGALPGPVATVAVSIWVAVPVVVAVVIAALLLRRKVLAALVALVLGSYALTLALIVGSASSSWEAGVIVAAVGGITSVVGGTALLIATRRPKAEPGE